MFFLKASCSFGLYLLKKYCIDYIYIEVLYLWNINAFQNIVVISGYGKEDFFGEFQHLKSILRVIHHTCIRSSTVFAENWCHVTTCCLGICST